MISREELLGLLEGVEADRVEFTTSAKDTDKFSRAVCAFANDLSNHGAPGYLIVGASDSGATAGLIVTDQLLQNLGALRSDGNIQPLPTLAVAKFTLPQGELAVVEVQPSDLPPVRYKGQVWIRVGPRRGIANEQEERLLSEKRLSAARFFDALPCPGASLKDLSLPLFEGYRQEVIAQEVIDSNQRSMEAQLASLRFFDLARGRPTHAGILLFGKSPRFHLPGAYTQYLRFPADDFTDTPVDQAEIAGDLLAVLREIELRTRANISTSLRTESPLREKQIPAYPEQAVRELVMNAVMHRDYQSNTPLRFYWFSNRLEIQNPGGLFGGVTPANYMTQNSYRNPVIAEAMKGLGYVNRFGYGIQRAQRLLADNGSPPAEFSFDVDAVRVIVRAKPQE